MAFPIVPCSEQVNCRDAPRCKDDSQNPELQRPLVVQGKIPEIVHKMILDPGPVIGYQIDTLVDAELPQPDHLLSEHAEVCSPLPVRIIDHSGIDC